MVQVVTSSDVFAGDADIVSIVTLINFFTSGRHEWSLDRQAVSAVEIFFADKVPALSGSVGALARKAWTSRTAWTSSTRRQMQQSSAHQVTAATIKAALSDLARPGVLVVEDLESDPVFVEAVVRVAKDAQIQDALTRNWLEFGHSGGRGRVVVVARDEVRKFQVKARVAAMIDSDSLFPGHQTQSHVIANRLVEELGICCHVLLYREIENYIPNRALSGIRPYSETRRRLNALKTLDEGQRAHFDFKKGFGRRNGRFERQPKEHQDLYSGVDARVMNELEDGFGANSINCLERTSSAMSMQDFSALGAGVRQELDDLLSIIRSLI